MDKKIPCKSKEVKEQLKKFNLKYHLKPERFVIKRKSYVHSIGEHHKERGKKMIEVYIDKKVPGWLINPYTFHEVGEDELERQKHYTYHKAHDIISHEEHKRFFPHSPHHWKQDLNFAKNLFNYRKRKQERKQERKIGGRFYE